MQANWEGYIAPKVTDLHGHLLPYPLSVDRSGKVSTLPGFKYFPDTKKARVLGKRAFAYLAMIRRRTRFMMTT